MLNGMLNLENKKMENKIMFLSWLIWEKVKEKEKEKTCKII